MIFLLIHKSFNEGLLVIDMGIFLDIYKTLDKVLHEDLVYKLKQNGVSGKLLKIWKDFLDSSKQRMLLSK